MLMDWTGSVGFPGCWGSKDCLVEALQVQHHIVLEDLLDWTCCWDSNGCLAVYLTESYCMSLAGLLGLQGCLGCLHHPVANLTLQTDYMDWMDDLD